MLGCKAISLPLLPHMQIKDDISNVNAADHGSPSPVPCPILFPCVNQISNLMAWMKLLRDLQMIPEVHRTR